MSCLCCLTIIKVVVILAIIRGIIKLLIAWDRSPTCLKGKTAIVTGANTGIGYYTALDFAKRGAKVILACRDKNKAEIAKKNIIKATDNPNVIVRLVDFSSLDSVREFAKEINATEERLDILVNNAGASFLERVTTKDGLNLLMQVNHFGPFLLTNLLLDLMKKSAPSRIVNVASAAADFAKLDVNDLNAYQKDGFFGNILDYSNTKLLNILFTNELARKLKGTNVTVNSLHPGSVRSEFFRNFPSVVKRVAIALSGIFLKTAEEGAQTSIYVAVSKNVEGVTGEYFDNCTVAWMPGMPKLAKDENLSREVWKKSEEFVKLVTDEKKSL